MERYKARLVAQGFTQKFGIDYDDTFCPVVRFESVRTVIALAVQNGVKLHQMDVATAFLNGELKEEMYMKQPEGFETVGQVHLVCRLKRSLYDLKQSLRCWNSVLDKRLKKMGFVQTDSDPCIYAATEGEMFVITEQDLSLASHFTLSSLEPIKCTPFSRESAPKFGTLFLIRLNYLTFVLS